MRLSHSFSEVSAVFDDPNLVSCGGLVPVLALAQRCGLEDLVAGTLTFKAKGGVNAQVKVPGVVAGMIAGADSITDLGLLRHGGMGRLFTGIRAPSTMGTFLRAFTFGHVRQLDAVAEGFLTGLAGHTPLLPGAGQVCFVDVDDTIRQTHGYAKEGAGYGYSKVKGLNVLLGVVSTPIAAPVIAGTRLRRGPSNSARGAKRLITDTLRTVKACGATGLVILRADSAYYGHDVIDAAVRGGARFSVTVRSNPTVTRAIASIPDDTWTAIHYPDAVWEEEEQRWISDAEVAEVGFTAFTSRPKSEQVSARLIVRRVKRLNPATDRPDQTELFTDSPLPMLDAEICHRRHAVIEQVIADLKAGPLAHLPSGSFPANSAWLVLAAIAFNLTRAAGCLASVFHAKAATATIRAQLITVPARLARSARNLVLHLPLDWPWRTAGSSCSSTPCTARLPRADPTHPARQGRPETAKWTRRAHRPTNHALPRTPSTTRSEITHQRPPQPDAVDPMLLLSSGGGNG